MITFPRGFTLHTVLCVGGSVTKDFALDQPRACFQRSGVTDAVVNKAKCNGVKHKPAHEPRPAPFLHRPRVGAVRGARAPRGALPPPRWTQPALGDRQLPAVTASGVRGAGAWGPGCLRLETQRPWRERPARLSVLIAFFIFYICGRLDVLGLRGPGEGWCESRAHTISHLPYQTLTSPLP